jgi:amino acid transporter
LTSVIPFCGIVRTMTMRGESPLRSEPLPRQLSGLAVWLLVINGIIGAGIFGLPGEAARLAGEFSPWVFVICAGLVLPVMLSFAELASHFDGTGGPMRYAYSAFGPYAGFQAGWASYVSRLTSFSANAVALVSAIGYFWPGADDPRMRLALLFAVCGGLTAITVGGTRNAMRSLGILTVLKFLPLIALVAYGILRLPGGMLASLQAAPPEHAGLGAALLLVFYAYVGFESGLVPAGEAKDPRRDIPRALVQAIVVVSILYIGLQTVSMAVMPDLAHTSRPLVEVSGRLIGPIGAALMMLGMTASVVGNLSGTLFTAPRLTYALALESSLPPAFARVSKRFGTPSISIIVFGTSAFLLAAGGSFVWLAGLSVLARLLIYIGCIAALPQLRHRASHQPKVIRLPGGLLIPGSAVLICLGLLTQAKPTDWLATALLLGVGSVLYALARRERAT